MRLWQAAKVGTIAGAAVLFVAVAPAASAGHFASQVSSAPRVTGPVSATPVTATPHLASSGSTTQQIRQIVQCKGTMYAVGTFSAIEQGTTSFVRHNVVSFSATSPYQVTSWDPNVSGTVSSITFSGGNCNEAIIGGSFKKINTTVVSNIAKISTSGGGAVDKKFGHNASGVVFTVLAVGNHILTGGQYTKINGGSADPYMTSLNPVTGKNDKYLTLNIHGHYTYRKVQPNATRVYNQSLSHSGKLDLVMGDFTSVARHRRQQIFMLSLGRTKASLTGWTSPEFDGSDGNLPNGFQFQCAPDNAFYVRAAAWSPTDSAVYLADTGYRPWNSTVNDPRSGLCDSASAWPATQKSVRHLWINYTGCDSLYSVAADSAAVYFAGHERWSQNPDGCDMAGPGAISAPGFEGLSPKTGALTFNPTRARGLGADDMLLTTAGLWIASDNFDDSNMCGGVDNLAGICLLPYN